MAELQLTNAGPLAAAASPTAKRGGAASGTEGEDQFSSLIGPQGQAESGQRVSRGAADVGDTPTQEGLPDAQAGMEMGPLVPLEDGGQVMEAVPGWPPQLAATLAGAVAVGESVPQVEQPAGVSPVEAAVLADDAAVAVAATAVAATAVATAANAPVAEAQAKQGSAAAGVVPQPAAPNVSELRGRQAPAPTGPAQAVAEALPSLQGAPAPDGVRAAAHTAVTAVHPVMQVPDGAAGLDVGDRLMPLAEVAARPGAVPAPQIAGASAGLGAPGGPVVDTRAPQWLNQTAAVLVHQAEAGATRARLVMHPAELGTVQVDLHLGADRRVDIVMTADTPAARDLMEQNAHQLRERLSEQGMSAGQLDVEVRQQQSEAGAGQSHADADGDGNGDDNTEIANDGADGQVHRERSGLLDAYA